MEQLKINELALLLRNNGDKILSAEFTLTLSGSMLHALNQAFASIVPTTNLPQTDTFQVTDSFNFKPYYRNLQLIYDFVQKTTLLCVVQYAGEPALQQPIDLGKFRALKRLEVQKLSVSQLIGIQKLRAQLQQLICVKCLQSVDEIITHCGGDNSTGFVWNELKMADFSYNQLRNIDTALEFAKYLQHLNLRHNQLESVEAIKWLPHLKTLDLSYNCLNSIPMLHMEACKCLQSLNVSNNSIEDLHSIVKLDALSDLDLSDNLLMEDSALLPLSVLSNLKFLNLVGNPLCCHPQHRLDTAQYLHKNCATVKFILNFETLTKSEKAATGRKKLRPIIVGKSHRSTSRMNINRSTPNESVTPASSVGSIPSFIETDNDSINRSVYLTPKSARRVHKVRSVEINEDDSTDTTVSHNDTTDVMPKSMQSSDDSENSLVKEQMEKLRQEHGANWLQYGNAEMLQSLHGAVSISMTDSIKLETERNISHQQFNDYLGDALSSKQASPATLLSSTPKRFENVTEKSDNATLYVTASEGQWTKELNNVTAAADETEQPSNESYGEVYAEISDAESEISDEEEDEVTYIVTAEKSGMLLFFSLSSQFLRERDPITRRTYEKWSLKILESCDRLKSNTLRINFDTVRRDKQERVYTVEDALCQQLESKLREILSERDLSEMNQTMYRCVNCTGQFSRENKYNLQQNVSCPYCHSPYVAEEHEPAITQLANISPAVIVQETALSLASPAAMIAKKNNSGESNSIGASASAYTSSNSRFHSSTARQQFSKTPNTKAIRSTRTKIDASKSSANSLHESSSCSKISSHSQSSFDSNQSVVGSSNTERELEFRQNIDSDVDIISNPSQSSIEVLDQIYASRKTSVSQVPHLDTINDNSYKQQSFIESELEHLAQLRRSDAAAVVEPVRVVAKSQQNAQFNLTESSSSGSVTDSICTSYEQTQLPAETETEKQQQQSNGAIKKDGSFSSKLGAILQSTNHLLNSRLSTLRDVETGKRTQSLNTLCAPYQFDYGNFTMVDHRLKFYFCSKIFKDKERLMWLVRGHIYNQQTDSIFDGVLLMSNHALYLMEVFAPEHDDVQTWLRTLLSVTVNRLECVQLLPWKIGLSFQLRDWGGFLLLLQDILRTDSLLLHFANNGLPHSCEVLHAPDARIVQRLNAVVSSSNERINMCALLNGCEVQRNDAKRTLSVCALLTTDTQLYLSTNQLNWLTLASDLTADADVADVAAAADEDLHDDEANLEICMLQFVQNLIEFQQKPSTMLSFTFRDETHDESEIWHCRFETKENADSFLNAIAHSWQKVFGVPLQATNRT